MINCTENNFDRWATHGEVSDKNAHPHTSDPNNEFIICHNGMINNYAEIKEMLVINIKS